MFGANDYDAKNDYDDAYDGKDNIDNGETITYTNTFCIIYVHMSRYIFGVDTPKIIY
ncbi:hypothetical protein FM120_18455 [Sphingobacterium faecium PCAi_F2.5]|nr:hypothetical protein FM120_18455 [Sphingobacterium faecium PCAi_F2.5]